MRNADDLRSFYEYCYWANARLLRALSRLSAEEFTREVGGSYGSVRNTLVHAMSAEWGWLARSGGRQRGPQLKAEDYPTVESLVETWAKVEGYVREFLSPLTDDDLAREMEFSLGTPEKQTQTLGELMHHGAVHGIHHRAQASLLIRMLGHAPGNLDLLFYNSERRGTQVP